MDRNSEICTQKAHFAQSLSARRAWIEMLASRLVDMSAAVALRKESVDRNNRRLATVQNPQSRSPQGERG